MISWKTITFYVITLSVLLPLHVYADSDGSFCIGSGYVAVETRGLYINAEKPSVYIVFVSAKGLSDRIRVAVPGDRNREIICEAGKIILSDGWIIDLRKPNKPKVIESKEIDVNINGSMLPYINKSTVMPIPSNDENHSYWAVLAYVEQLRPSSSSIYHHFSARVVQIDKYSNFIKSTLIADGMTLETID